MAPLAVVFVLEVAALVAPGSTAWRLVGALAVAAIALVLLFLVDAFAAEAFQSVGDLVRALSGASLAAAVLTLGLAWEWPWLFSSYVAIGLPPGAAVVAMLVASTALIPAARREQGARCRALLLGGARESALDEEATGRLARSVDIIGRGPLRATDRRLAEEIERLEPQLLLVDAPVSDVDFELVRLCTERSIRLLVLVRPPYWLMAGRPVVRLAGVPWVSLAPLRVGGRHARAKRALDLGLILIAAPLLLPLLAVVAVSLAVTSPGGVFYRQKRVGLGDRPFVVLKFRTMRPDAERESGPVLAERADPRVTRAGGALRRLRLDELPQLWNVLRGDMSLVGPRPERPELVPAHGLVRDYDARHLVRPGLTGLAQLVGGYTATHADKVRCDLLYLTSRSFSLDLRLIVWTLVDLARGFPHG